MREIICEVGSTNEAKSIFEMFIDVFEAKDEPNLDKLQIITPRRIGNFGSMMINKNIVLDGKVEFRPKTKLICEENIYLKEKRILGLANGSIGYIKEGRRVYFEDISELIEDYGWKSIQNLIKEIRKDIYSPLRSDKRIDFAYAITVHKAQGSDFEYVIFILSEVSPFIIRELLYTAFTRARKKLYFIVHNDLKDELLLVLAKAFENSSVEERNTLLFGYKVSPFRPYSLALRDGRVIEVKSKIEYIIAKTLDRLGIKFEYEPKEFQQEYHVIPDFKLFLEKDGVYYLEHLGNMSDLVYRERWFQKFEVYKKLGIADILITTSESEEKSNIEEGIKRIINDIKSNKLRETKGGYSSHHYYI